MSQSKEELMVIHDALLEDYETAQEQNDEEKIIAYGKKYFQFVSANCQVLGVSEEDVGRATKSFQTYEDSFKHAQSAQLIYEDSTRQMIESARHFGESLWHHMRRLSSAPPHIKLTPDYKNSYQTLCGFWETYERSLDKFEIELILGHLRFRLDFYKQMLATGDEFALPKLKLDLLETALAELQTICEAETDLEDENSLAAYETKRVRELFNQIAHAAYAPPASDGH